VPPFRTIARLSRKDDSREGRGTARQTLWSANGRHRAGSRERGAPHIDLGTSEDDTAGCMRAGFTNREGGRDGPRMLYYERDL